MGEAKIAREVFTSWFGPQGQDEVKQKINDLATSWFDPHSQDEIMFVFTSWFGPQGQGG